MQEPPLPHLTEKPSLTSVLLWFIAALCALAFSCYFLNVLYNRHVAPVLSQQPSAMRVAMISLAVLSTVVIAAIAIATKRRIFSFLLQQNATPSDMPGINLTELQGSKHD